MQAALFSRAAATLPPSSISGLAEAMRGHLVEASVGSAIKFLFSDGSSAVLHPSPAPGIEVFDTAGTQVRERRLFSDHAGNLVEVLEHTEPLNVRFSAQGGGLVRTAPLTDFERMFRPAALPAFTRKAVSAEWLPDDLRLPAYTDGQRWNGWAMPYFELAVAQQLLEHLPNLRYDSERDAFVSEPYDDEGDVEIFAAEVLWVSGRPVRAYAIGAGSWCWWLES